MEAKILYWVMVVLGAVLVIMPKLIVQLIHGRRTGEKAGDYEPPARHRLLVMALGALILVLGTLWYYRYR